MEKFLSKACYVLAVVSITPLFFITEGISSTQLRVFLSIGTIMPMVFDVLGFYIETRSDDE